MNWEKLTAGEFATGVKESCGVCLLPAGVLEKHGDHLPLGQDSIFIHDLCREAAAKEPAMVFPFFFLGSIVEGKHQPGTVALKNQLLTDVFENVCDEIARNGFTKILIVNGHGGNRNFLANFCARLLEARKDYVVMTFFPWAYPIAAVKELLFASVDEHGGEDETSCMLHYHPELVKSNTPASYGLPLQRMAEYRKLGIDFALDWYADFPGHLSADDTPGTPEKGRRIVEERVRQLAEIIRLIKHDNTAIELQREYQRLSCAPLD